MKNFLKIFILLIVFIIILFPYVKAINMNLDDSNIDTPETNLNNTSELSIDNSNDETNSNVNAFTYTQPPVVTTSSNNEFLTVENILSILIIVIGIILIFLAIAIIIRCK